MADGKFSSTVSALFQGMESFLTTKTVVGDAVKFDDDTIILPLVDVSFGMGAGSFVNGSKDNSGGGMSGKMTPSAVLVIQNGHARLVNIKNQDALTKIFDMVPDLVDKFTKDDVTKEKEKEVDEKATEIVKESE
jgi:uncharacterized spore protein YtfJ